MGALWFEALGMWSVVFSWGVWCVSLGDRRVELATLGLRVWCTIAVVILWFSELVPR